MLLNYYNLTKGDYRNMYYTKIQYYQYFPAEVKYKDLHKQRRNIQWRSYKEMKKDIKAQHKFFTNPVISSVEEDDDEVNDDYDDEDFDIGSVDNYY